MVGSHQASRSLPEAPAPAEEKRKLWLDLGAMRSAIAAAMARSKREIPHYYLAHQIDVTPCEQWLTQRNAQRPPDERILISAAASRPTTALAPSSERRACGRIVLG
jgi:pyruvate dehydrogenase E2 component (dihydrolipoamide acetyltransferase)